MKTTLKVLKMILNMMLIAIAVVWVGPAFVMVVPMMIALVWSFFGTPPQILADIAQIGFDNGIWNW